MGNLVSIRLRIIAAAWMGSVAEPGDLGVVGGAPALDEHEAVAHAQRVAARERRHLMFDATKCSAKSSSLSMVPHSRRRSRILALVLSPRSPSFILG